MFKWLNKTRKSLKKEGGLLEKQVAINRMMEVSSKILNDRREHNVKVEIDRRILQQDKPLLT